MDHRIINLCDRSTHGAMSRQTYRDRLADIAGSTAAAAALLPLLQNDYAKAAIIPPDDRRLAAERVSFNSAKGRIGGYFIRPTAEGKRPVVLVIHENRGLNPHLEDIARRLALEGFSAYAIDLLSLVGGTPENEDAARELHGKLDQKDAVATLLAAVAFLKNIPSRPTRSALSAFVSVERWSISSRRQARSWTRRSLITAGRFRQHKSPPSKHRSWNIMLNRTTA